MTRVLEIAPRKQPRQERAQSTVGAILQAAAQVFVQEGVERATTNRIAQVAGVSVGSLYQYFPSKEALVAAIIDQHRRKVIEQLSLVADNAAELPLEEAARAFIGLMIDVHTINPPLHRVLLEYVPFHESGGPQALIEEHAARIVEGYMVRHREQIQVPSISLATTVVVFTVKALMWVAVLSQPALLHDPCFREEITRLVVGYLRGGPAPVISAVRS